MTFAAQAVAVCASETKIGGAYIAVVTEAAPALPEIPDVEEEAELAEEAPIAPPGDYPCFWHALNMSACLFSVDSAEHAFSCSRCLGLFFNSLQL